GRPLIDHVTDMLSAQTAQVIVCGRDHGTLPAIADTPAPHMGPLGGVAAALLEAQARGFSAVLTVPRDAVDLPDDLVGRLFPYPAYVASMPVIGLWPAWAAKDALAILNGEGKYSMRAFAARIGARAVQLPRDPVNIN